MLSAPASIERKPFARGGPGEQAGLPGSPCPLGRYVTNEECAAMAVYLSSDGASGCNGNPYIVDGGYCAR